MLESDKYRQVASDCIRLAQLISAGAIDPLLKMAETWLILSRRYEQRASDNDPQVDL
jgi:hypothetical protein